MTRISILVTLALLGLVGTGYAQDNLVSFTYEVSIPLSDTKEFTEPTSFIGFNFEGRRFVQPNTTVGFSVGLHVFDEVVNDDVIELSSVFENERNLDVWGTQYRYINSWPLMMNAFYYPGDTRARTRPYIGTGVGAFAAVRRLDMGLSSVSETTWQIGFAPEVGVIHELEQFSLILKGSYNYGLAAGEVSALSYFKIGAGFAWNTGY